MTDFSSKILVEFIANAREEEGQGYILFNFEHNWGDYHYLMDNIVRLNDFGMVIKRITTGVLLGSRVYRISYNDRGMELGYSCGLIDQLKTYGAIKLYFSDNLPSGYLVGGEYLLDDKVLLFESYQDKKGDNYLLLLLDNTAITPAFKCRLREIINLNNGSRIGLLRIGYQLNEHLTPSLSLISHYREGDTAPATLPWKREISFGLEVRI